MIVNGESSRTLQTYFIWCFVISQIDSMPKRFRMVKQEFNRVFQGISSEKARSIKCITYVNRYMGFALSKLYLEKYFDETARNEVFGIYFEKSRLNFFSSLFK